MHLLAYPTSPVRHTVPALLGESRGALWSAGDRYRVAPWGLSLMTQRSETLQI